MNKYLPLFGLFLSFAAAAEEPIEVIIYAEEMGYGGIQCHDPERGKIPTPNVDKSACQTMRFTDRSFLVRDRPPFSSYASDRKLPLALTSASWNRRLWGSSPDHTGTEATKRHRTSTVRPLIIGI